MKNLTVISGKGGTGKTSLVGSFAVLGNPDLVLVDADVDAANLSLITTPEVLEEHEFRASCVAEIDHDRCLSCNLCRELCRFEAIDENFVVDPIACEGCGFCYYTCPEKAIEMVEALSARWFVSRTGYGTLVHARLGIAEENSGRLVTEIRNKAQEIAEKEKKSHILIDGPPGIGCPVIASLSGIDAALIVTEPTVSGIHDLGRIVSVCRHFGVTASVCVNRYDLDEKQTAYIGEYCRKENIKLIGKVPFDRRFVEAVVEGIPVAEYCGGALRDNLEEIWNNFLYQ